MTATSPSDPRLLDLLADRALDGLDAGEARELTSLLAAEGLEDDISFDLAAASAALAFIEPVTEELPAHLRSRLLTAAKPLHGASRTAPAASPAQVRTMPRIAPESAAIRPTSSPQPVVERSTAFRLVPWLAAAAGIALAAIAWWPTIAEPVTPAARLSQLEARPGTMELAWQDWDNPEIAGVKGEVVWCEAEQEGYMKFVGLPPNDPTREQYQLWIIDKRGMQKRVSGGVFNVDSSGEVVVPIHPGVRIKDAAAFAVTIEEPGGTPVSDMDRRVVIAAKG